jgi:hypothetical protein
MVIRASLTGGTANGSKERRPAREFILVGSMPQHVGAKPLTRPSLKPLTYVDSIISVPDTKIHNYRLKNFGTVIPVGIRASETCRVQIHANTTVMVTMLSTSNVILDYRNFRRIRNRSNDKSIAQR